MSRSFPSPPSSSLAEESSRRAPKRRRRRRFFCRFRASPSSIPQPPAILQPRRLPLRPPGEAPVLLDPFPFFLSHRSAASFGPWEVLAMAELPAPGQRGLPADGPWAPAVSCFGSV
jgi:hypothetical protein